MRLAGGKSEQALDVGGAGSTARSTSIRPVDWVSVRIVGGES
jgi:hypothetical protein